MKKNTIFGVLPVGLEPTPLSFQELKPIGAYLAVLSVQVPSHTIYSRNSKLEFGNGWI